MPNIDLLNDLSFQMKEFLDDLETSNHQLKETILQRDNADKLEEKLVSIGISTTFVITASSFIGILGLSLTTGVVGGLLSFGTGVFLSKKINKKLFGNERAADQLSSDELTVIEESKCFYDSFKKLHKQLKYSSVKPEIVDNIFLFTEYPVLRVRFFEMHAQVKGHKPENLAYKYRSRYSKLTKKYSILLRTFDSIYSNS